MLENEEFINQLIKLGIDENQAKQMVKTIIDLFNDRISEIKKESIDEYKDKLSIDLMAKILKQMRLEGWDGKPELADKYFDNIIDKLNNKKIDKDIEIESKELKIEDDETDKSIFDNLEYKKDQKTIFEYLAERIGQKLSIGEFNTVLQSIFGMFDTIFIERKELENIIDEEEQKLEVYNEDEDIFYIIKYRLIDKNNLIIEITDIDME